MVIDLRLYQVILNINTITSGNIEYKYNYNDNIETNNDDDISTTSCHK